MPAISNPYFDPVLLSKGQQVYTYEYIEELREKLKNNKKFKGKAIIPQKGGQEKLMLADVDCLIYAGNRGVGKTAALLMGAYYQIESPYFSGVIFRQEKNDSKDAGSIADASVKFYKAFGKYNKSDQDMTWNFNKGGSLKFGYYSDKYNDFVTRFRGKEISYIGIDEITQMPFSHFRFLFSVNRNSHGLQNIIIGTCNPDGDSWAFRFYGGTYIPKKGEKPRRKWIDEDGRPIPEMDGKILYFFMYGERADQVYWGETRKEVYEQAKTEIDRLYTKEMEEKGLLREDAFILSTTLISGKLTDNEILTGSPDYIRRVAALPPEERERDLEGRWITRSNTSTLITLAHLDKIFESREYQRDNYRCVTADISLKGGDDPSVLYYWEGFHLADIATYKDGAETLKIRIRSFLDKHGIPYEDFCFDATGIGEGLCEYFAGSMQYVATTKAFDQREIEVGKLKQTISSYENVKAQTVDYFAKRVRACGYSIEDYLLYTKYENKMLIDHLREEYVTIAQDATRAYGKFKIIEKKKVIDMIGHSPDFMDAWYLREFIDLHRTHNKKVVRRIGVWMI